MDFIFPKGSQKENEQKIEQLFTVRNKVIEKPLKIVDAHLSVNNELSPRERSGFLFKQIFDLKFKKE